MMLFRGKSFFKPIIVVGLLLVLLGVVAGCEGYGFPTTTPTPTATERPSATVISTRDSAMLAVYQHLLAQAKSYEAKRYLADFYATCDNWTAEGEYFKDGSGIWYIQVDMSSVALWKARAYWQQASWFVYRDGKVIASNRLKANALRIEADLQELSKP